MKRKISIFLFLLTYSLCFSQEKSAVNAYVDYFKLPRETLFLHTNKTTFLPGEEIWFKAYAYDRKSQLTSKATTNIRLGIFDKEGKQIDQKLFLAKDGVANGNIKIDSTFASGEYYLKASTNWMKNFKEGDAFVKQIRVINPKSKETDKLRVSNKEFDIQFLPEGGHLLAGVKNVVGLKAIDDMGKGAMTSGVIVDTNGKEIVNFKSNALGLGRFSFTPQSNGTYKAIVKLANSKKVEINLPKIENEGIAIQVNNLSPNDVVITLSTNKRSFDDILEHGKYSLLIHKDGVTKVIPMEFTTTQEKIIISKKDLFKGVNTITLMDKHQKPVLERMFFNEALIKNYNITLQRTESSTDSISYKFISGLEDNNVLNASVSVLPKETKSYNPRHSILSAFYLKPYVKGTIENPAQYFTELNRKKKYELDVLLLTQGWSRYDWDDVFNNPPTMDYTFNNGLTLRGDMNDEAKNINKLILFPSVLNDSRNIKFDQDGKFEISNFMPVKDEYLVFTAATKKGKTKKPGLVVNFLTPLEEEFIDVNLYQNFKSYYSNKSSIDGFVSTNTVVLDEVVLKAQRDKEKRKEYRLATSGKLHNVTQDLNRRYLNLAQFLGNNGFDVNILSGSVRHLLPSRNPVVFFLNNVQINDPTIVSLRPMFEFEDIFIDATLNANIVSIRGNPSTLVTVVKVFTRRTPFSFSDARPPNENAVKVPYGFESTKTFYSPKYGGFDTELFQDLGAIHWSPNFVMSKNSIENINTLNTGLNEVTFYIEGITTNGDLISQTITVDHSEQP